MSKRKSSLFNMVLALAVITVVSAIALGFVSNFTEGPIAAARLAKQMRAIDAVLPQYDNDVLQDKLIIRPSNTADSLEVFPARQDGEILGFAIKSKSSKGYSGDIWIMVGIDTDGNLIDTYVIEHKETPGLGSKMRDTKFKSQYTGLDLASADIRVTKDGGTIDAISGATISSRAFSEAVSLAYQTFQTIDNGTGN